MSVDRGDMDNIFDSWSVAERKSESIQNNETKQSIELILDSNLEISNDGSAA